MAAFNTFTKREGKHSRNTVVLLFALALGLFLLPASGKAQCDKVWIAPDVEVLYWSGVYVRYDSITIDESGVRTYHDSFFGTGSKGRTLVSPSGVVWYGDTLQPPEFKLCSRRGDSWDIRSGNPNGTQSRTRNIGVGTIELFGSLYQTTVFEKYIYDPTQGTDSLKGQAYLRWEVVDSLGAVAYYDGDTGLLQDKLYGMIRKGVLYGQQTVSVVTTANTGPCGPVFQPNGIMVDDGSHTSVTVATSLGQVLRKYGSAWDYNTAVASGQLAGLGAVLVFASRRDCSASMLVYVP